MIKTPRKRHLGTLRASVTWAVRKRICKSGKSRFGGIFANVDTVGKEVSWLDVAPWLEDKFAGELSDFEFPKNGDCFRKTEYQSTNMLNLRRYHDLRKRVITQRLQAES